MVKQRILIVDDEKEVVDMVSRILEEEGYVAISANTSEEALEKIKKSKPDLIILDLKLPTIGGLEVCRILKSNKDTRTVPVIMLTCYDSNVEKVMGLRIGADDYIIKPFDPNELVARIKALFRRMTYLKDEKDEDIIKSGKIVIDLKSHTAQVESKPVELWPKEFALLYLLLKKKGRVLTREYLCEAVWGYEYFGTTRTIDATVWRLRKKLGSQGKYIKTVKNIGYIFNEEEISINDYGW